MARKSANNQKGSTTSSGEQALSWSQFWAWFGSDVITDSERKETFLRFLKSRIFSSMPVAAQMEVLEFAPDYILKYLVAVKQVSQELVDQIKSGETSIETTSIRPMTYKELVAVYKR